MARKDTKDVRAISQAATRVSVSRKSTRIRGETISILIAQGCAAFLKVDITEQIESKPLRKYKNRPARVEKRRTFHLQITRHAEKLAKKQCQSETLLAVFKGIILTIIQTGEKECKEWVHLKPLRATQKRILQLLGMTEEVYTSLVSEFSKVVLKSAN